MITEREVRGKGVLLCAGGPLGTNWAGLKARLVSPAVSDKDWTARLASCQAMQEGVGIETMGGVWAWWGTDDDRARRGHREVYDKWDWVSKPHPHTPPPCTGHARVHAPAIQYPGSTPFPTPPRLHPTARDRAKVVAKYLSVLVPVPLRRPRLRQGVGPPLGLALGPVEVTESYCNGPVIAKDARPCLAIDRLVPRARSHPCKYVRTAPKIPNRDSPGGSCWGRKDRLSSVEHEVLLGGKARSLVPPAGDFPAIFGCWAGKGRGSREGTPADWLGRPPRFRRAQPTPPSACYEVWASATHALHSCSRQGLISPRSQARVRIRFKVSGAAPPPGFFSAVPQGRRCGHADRRRLGCWSRGPGPRL